MYQSLFCSKKDKMYNASVYACFSPVGTASPFAMDGIYRRPPKRNVADERGAEGLNPEYMFSHQFKTPSRTQSAHSMCAETTSPDG